MPRSLTAQVTWRTSADGWSLMARRRLTSHQPEPMPARFSRSQSRPAISGYIGVEMRVELRNEGWFSLTTCQPLDGGTTLETTHRVSPPTTNLHAIRSPGLAAHEI